MNDRRPHGRPRWLVAVTLALVAACTGSPGGSATDGDPAQGGSEASMTPPESGVSAAEQVAAVVDTYLAGDLTGASEDVRAVLVTVGGRPVLERYYDSSAEATSGVFSVTKSVMSILIGIALDEGDLGSVEQTLAELLPEYATTMAQEVAGVTLRQVLTMTAGLPEDTAGSDPLPFETADDWIAAIVSGGLVRPAGEDFAYASAGSHLLSAILVEATTGRPVLDYAREKLFDPLGIDTDPRRGAPRRHRKPAGIRGGILRLAGRPARTAFGTHLSEDQHPGHGGGLKGSAQHFLDSRAGRSLWGMAITSG
jgi:CubicO group peptidase (beta-lactamase class C family)